MYRADRTRQNNKALFDGIQGTFAKITALLTEMRAKPDTKAHREHMDTQEMGLM